MKKITNERLAAEVSAASGTTLTAIEILLREEIEDFDTAKLIYKYCVIYNFILIKSMIINLDLDQPTESDIDDVSTNYYKIVPKIMSNLNTFQCQQMIYEIVNDFIKNYDKFKTKEDKE